MTFTTVAPTQSATYDSRNRVHIYTDPLGQTTSYGYDGLNRLHTITYQDGSSNTITWDAGNRPTQFADTLNGTISRQYGGMNSLTEESGPHGTVDYFYDAAERRMKMVVSGQSTAMTYQYDNGNRLTQIAQGTTIVGTGYDALSRRSSISLPNGIVTTPTYDDASELTALSYDRSGVHVGDLAYGYDAAGRRTSQGGSLATLGLPTTVNTASYDAANRLTSWGGTAITYDGNGNMLGVGASTYTWNTRNQLTATSDGIGAFSYDPLGRRVSRTVSGATVPYLYDGDNPATVSGNQILAGQWFDDFFAQVTPGGTQSYLSDAFGSTVAVTNSSGAVTSSYSYGPYGSTTIDGTAETVFQYTGRENDGATNLYYL